MRLFRKMIGGLLVACAGAGCGGGGLEAGLPAEEYKGVAPTIDAKPISSKDMPKVKNKGPVVPIPGRP